MTIVEMADSVLLTEYNWVPYKQIKKRWAVSSVQDVLDDVHLTGIRFARKGTPEYAQIAKIVAHRDARDVTLRDMKGKKYKKRGEIYFVGRVGGQEIAMVNKRAFDKVWDQEAWDNRNDYMNPVD